VQSVAQGAIWRIAWAGDAMPRVEALSAMTPGADVQPDRVSC